MQKRLIHVAHICLKRNLTLLLFYDMSNK